LELPESIRQRRSVRAFGTDPISRELLAELLEQALQAPSWANTQPWKFAIASGKPLQEIQDEYLKREQPEPDTDIARPYEFPEPYLSRIKALAPPGVTIDEEYMQQRRIRNFRNYGAPAVIYLLIERTFFYQDKGINAWSLYDCGSVIQNIMLLATHYGLGTIAQAQAVIFPDIIRAVLDIPDSTLIALGIAIGYPDMDDPGYQRRTRREPVAEVTKWYGFETHS